MKSVDQYFSIVTDRMEELQKKLEIAQHKKNYSKGKKSYQRHQLECDMLEKKINYLKRIENLPLLLAIENLPVEELAKLNLSQKLPEGCSKEQLIQLFHLEGLAKWVKSPKIVTLAYMKDAFMGDLDTMATLLELNQRNFELREQKQKLYGVGLDGSNSYLKISFDEKALNRQEETIEAAANEIQQNFNMTSLREVYCYMHNTQSKLSYEFIEKYGDQVIKSNPEMAKTVKRLKHKKHFKWLNKILPLKRNKDEHAFMNAVLNYYNHNKAAEALGIATINVFDMNERELREFVKYTKRQIARKREGIAFKREQIFEARKEVLQQIKDCESIQNQKREIFVNLIRSKTTFHPKRFEEQLWNEPNLRDSIILESCYLEDKMITEQLMEALKVITTPIEVKQLEPAKEKIAVNKLVA